MARLALLEPRPPVQRYEVTTRGALVHIDIKPLARIVRVGHRIHGDRSRRVVAAGAAVRLSRTRPRRPQTNAKAERFIQTLIRGWAYAVPYRTSGYRTRALRAWLRSYNTTRPHAALGYHPPCVRFPRLLQ